MERGLHRRCGCDAESGSDVAGADTTSDGVARGAGGADYDDDVAGMVGDVNLFLLPAFEAEEYAALAGGADAAAESEAAHTSAPVAEVMVMIAEPSGRRRGLAQDAVTTMMEWGA